MFIKSKRIVKYLVMISACAILIAMGIFSACNTAKPTGVNDMPDQEEIGHVTKIFFPKPESHKAGWLEYHGGFYDLNWDSPGQQGNACLTCHEKTECLQCHSTRLPRNHKSTWRTLGHGFAASGDRERCLTCHKQDYCIRCHNETAPRSHKGNWEDNHCGQCHYDSGIAFGTSCAACHQQIRHLSAPHSINPQSDCMVCH